MKLVLFWIALNFAFVRSERIELIPRGSGAGSNGSPDSQGTPPSTPPPVRSIPQLPPPTPRPSTKTRSVLSDVLSKADQRATRAERIASASRLRYHDAARDFQKRYGAAHMKYNYDLENPAVSVENLYSERRKADGLMKKVGRAQKNLANAYADAAIATDEAGNHHRSERNQKKAETTAAHFFATKATYKTATDSLKAKHLPPIATRTRARGKTGASGKAQMMEAAAARASDRTKLNEYVMHSTTKRYRQLRNSGGRDTESEFSDSY